MRELTTVVVEKVERGWCARLVILDRGKLYQLLKPAYDYFENKGLSVPKETYREIHTTWMSDQVRGDPFYSILADCPIESKCIVIIMFMYGARPTQSRALDIIRKASPQILDPVRGIFGDKTLIRTCETSGARVCFSLPAAGYLPKTFPALISRLCGNGDKGECSICGMKRLNRFVFGKVYPCKSGDHFIHDYCALSKYHDDFSRSRDKVWKFFCGDGHEHEYSSPSRLFNPIRLTVMTGDNVGALKKTVEKYLKNGEDTASNIDGHELAKGVRSMLQNVGLTRHCLTVPDVTHPANFVIDQPKGSKAGAFMQREVYEFLINSEVRSNRQNPEKTTVTVIAGAYLQSFITSLKEEFQEFVVDGRELDAKKLQEFTWKRLFVYKVNTKVEAIYGEEVDGDKIRCFFPAHICKFVLDNMIWKGLVVALYNKGSVMLGHKWVHGGAQKLFDRLKKSNKIFAWDISGLDSSMKARLIQIIFQSLFRAYNPKSVPDDVFRIFTMLYHISVGQYVSKVVSWIDGFRIMVGAMASGELMTSIFNTIYCITAVLCWIHHCADIKFGPEMVLGGAKEKWLRLNADNIILYIFGDDGLMGTDAVELELFKDVRFGKRTYPSLSTYLKVHWKLTVKESESTCVPGKTPSLLSTPNEVGDLPAGSVTILKRGFVEMEYKGQKCVGPFKSTTISIGKLVKQEIPSLHKEDPLYVNYLGMCRSVGHAVDTCGTNQVMYNVCAYYYDLSFSEFMLAWNTGSKLSFAPEEELVKVVEERLRRLFGTGKIDVGQMSVTKFPERDAILDMFVPKKEVYDEPEPEWKAKRLRRPDVVNQELYNLFTSLRI